MKPSSIQSSRCYLAAGALALSMMLTHCDQGPGRDDEREKPNETRAEEPEDVVELFPEAARQIHTVEISNGSGYTRDRFPGYIEFNRNKTASVTSPMEGRLLEWLTEPGQMVKAGDVLARVENPQNLGQPIEIKSPITGEIVLRSGSLGGPVTTNEPQFVVSDLDVVWAVAEVREDMAGIVIAGVPAELRVLAFPDEIFGARIFNESASVQRESHTIDFFLEVPNPDHKLRDGMFTYVALATGQIKDKLIVPEEALQRIRGDSVVFVERGGAAEYQLRKVRLGRKLGDAYEVLDGLEPGNKVATRGSFLLKSEYLKSELAEDDD